MYTGAQDTESDASCALPCFQHVTEESRKWVRTTFVVATSGKNWKALIKQTNKQTKLFPGYYSHSHLTTFFQEPGHPISFSPPPDFCSVGTTGEMWSWTEIAILSYWWLLSYEAHRWDQGFIVAGDATTRMPHVPAVKLAPKCGNRSQWALKYSPQVLAQGSNKPAEFPREWHYQNLLVGWLHRREGKNNISNKWTGRVQRDNKHLNSTWKTSSSTEL